MRPNSHRFSTRHQLMQHNVHQRPEMYNSFKISPKPCPTNATHLFTHRSSSTNTWLGWNVHFNSSSRPRTRYLGESCRERNVRGKNSLVCSSSGKFIHFHSFLLFFYLSHYLTHYCYCSEQALLSPSCDWEWKGKIEENYGNTWNFSLLLPLWKVKTKRTRNCRLAVCAWARSSRWVCLALICFGDQRRVKLCQPGKWMVAGRCGLGAGWNGLGS